MTQIKFTSELNDKFYYIIEKESIDYFYYRAINKETEKKSDRLIPEIKDFFEMSLRDKTYKIF